jgi:hypothetical protein
VSPTINPVAGGSSGSSLPLVRVSQAVTSAQVLALFSNPLVLVAAPGAGKAICVESGWMFYKAGTTPYTTGGANLQLAPLSVATTFLYAACFNAPQAGLIDQAASRTAILEPASNSPVPSSDFSNQPLALASDTADPTLGNGTLLLSFYYTIVTLP